MNDGLGEVGEPPSTKWRRRAKTVPTMLGLTVIAFAMSPLIIAALAFSDLFGARFRLPRVRLFLFGLQYVFNDSVEILSAPFLWVAAGFGTRVSSVSSQARHARLQVWSIATLVSRAEKLLGIRLIIEGAEELSPAPAIYLARHVSLLDASLPHAIMQGVPRINIKSVIMAEMLADPGFDLIYSRLGSIFINRDRGGEAQDAIRELGRTLNTHSAGLIFPEGRLFDAAALQRALDRLTESDPQRAAKLAALSHVLPPRPGGFQSLLEGSPASDVVIISHHGFETIPSFRELSTEVPIKQQIVVSVERVERNEIPTDRDGQVQWLDDRWLELDRWIDSETKSSADSP